MQTVNVHAAKTKLSALLAMIEKSGDGYVICRNNKPIADLIPHQSKNRLDPDPFLSKVKIKCDLTKPMTEDEWEDL